MRGRAVRGWLRAAPPAAAALCLIGLVGGMGGAPGRAQTCGPAPGSPAALRTIRVVLSNTGVSNSGLYVADGRGYFEQLGIRIEYVQLTYASQLERFFLEQRLIPEAPPVNSFVDNSFSQYAAHVLGPASLY